MFNNVTRTALEALAATQGRTQSLHTNALDEAIALPTDFSARIARNTQLLIQQESGTCRVADPWGGSFYVERLTYELARGPWRASTSRGARRHGPRVAAGVPKMRIEEAAARAQARIDSGRQTIVGVNKFRAADDATIEILKVDNRKVREQQIAKLERLRAERPKAVAAARLDGGRRRQGEPARARRQRRARDGHRGRNLGRAGEGLHAPPRGDPRHLGRLPRGGRRQSTDIARVRRLAEEFDKNDGRRPRILIAKMGQDGRDRGQKVIASAFADLGFDVDIGPLFATPEEAARQAVENDVHVLGVSSLAAGHLILVPDLKAALAKEGRDDIMIVVGGVIPPADYEALYAAGAKAVFGPGTNILEAAADLIEKLNELRLPRPGRGRITARHLGAHRGPPRPRGRREGPAGLPSCSPMLGLGGGGRCARG